MAFGTRGAFEAVREVAFGSITASYTTLGSAFTDHVRIIRFVNGTDKDMYISTDGSTNMLRLATNSYFILDLSANKVRDDGLFLPLGTQLYIKYQAAPSSGTFWTETLYAQGGV